MGKVAKGKRKTHGKTSEASNVVERKGLLFANLSNM